MILIINKECDAPLMHNYTADRDSNERMSKTTIYDKMSGRPQAERRCGGEEEGGVLKCFHVEQCKNEERKTAC